MKKKCRSVITVGCDIEVSLDNRVSCDNNNDHTGCDDGVIVRILFSSLVQNKKFKTTENIFLYFFCGIFELTKQ